MKESRSIETGFSIQSVGHGNVTFQAFNGKFIVPHATGHMRTVTDQLNSTDAYFRMKFINRPFCVLKCDFGYIGYRNKQSRLLECNRSLFTLFTLEEADDGIVYLKGLIKKQKKKPNDHFDSFLLGIDGFYWELTNDLNLSVSGCEPSKFSLELCSSHSRVVIKGPNGMYLRAEQSGSIQATCENSRQASQWEF